MIKSGMLETLNFLSVPLDTEFREGLDIPDTANTFVQGEIKTLSMDDWMKTSN